MGQITIQQKKEKNRKKPTWIAEFTVNLVKILARIEGDHCPTASTWELLNQAGWTVPMPAEVRLEQSRPRYQVIADEVAKRYAKCKSIAAVAASMKTYEMIVSHALAFATTGEKPKWRPKKLRNRNPKRTGATKSYKYVVHAADVARLRDEETLVISQNCKKTWHRRQNSPAHMTMCTPSTASVPWTMALLYNAANIRILEAPPIGKFIRCSQPLRKVTRRSQSWLDAAGLASG